MINKDAADWMRTVDRTRDHVARLWGINHSGASKRLRVLRDKGFIDDKSVFVNFHRDGSMID